LKILVVMGSPRKGNTYQACENLRSKMEQYNRYDFEYLWLRDAMLLPCRGCYSCIRKGEHTCPNQDDAAGIGQKMAQADGIVFASPVYGMNVSGQMKNFIDRFSYIFHRPRFFGKKACLVVTTGALGQKEVIGYLDMVASVWGCNVAGKAALITPPSGISPRRVELNNKIIGQTASGFAAALGETAQVSPGIRKVFIFHAQRAAFSNMEKESPCDYQYWKEKGWLSSNARYYTDVPVNPLYSTIGTIAGAFLSRKVRNDFREGREKTA
jgi:multimeric flavodoxin WrbA